MGNAVKPPPGFVRPKERPFRKLEKWAVNLSALLLRPHVLMFSVLLGLILLHVFTGAMRFERFENILHDGLFRARPSLTVSPDIVLVEIAEDSIQQIGRWPWPRHFHAAMTHILTQWGARAIFFDILFSEPSEPFEDQSFAEAVKQSGRVYMPVVLEPDGKKFIWIKPLPELREHLKGVGHINMNVDRDGVLRRIQPEIDREGERYPHLALQMALDFSGQDWKSGQPLPFPSDKNGGMMINWAGKWDHTFSHYSYSDILKSFQQIKSGKKPLIDPAAFKNKIVLIGLVATGHTDIKPIPIEAAYPGLGVHANVINGLLTQQYVRHFPEGIYRVMLALYGLLCLAAMVPFRQRLSPILIVLLGGFWWFLCYLFLARFGLLLDPGQPVLMLVLIAAISLPFELFVTAKDKFYFLDLATRDGLTGLYVIRYFRSKLPGLIARSRKRGEPLSLIMIDIDNFKKVNDTYGHQAGDLILKSVAQSVLAAVRVRRTREEEDMAVRYGGEEMMICLQKCNLTDAAFKVAERVRKSVEEQRNQWQETVIPVTISLGVSMFHPEAGDTEEALIRRADEALYRAKHEGKNRVCIEDFSKPRN